MNSGEFKDIFGEQESEELAEVLKQAERISDNVDTVFKDIKAKVKYPFIYVEKMTQPELEDLQKKGVLQSGLYPLFKYNSEENTYSLLGSVKFDLSVYKALIRFCYKDVYIKESKDKKIKIDESILNQMLLER